LQNNNIEVGVYVYINAYTHVEKSKVLTDEAVSSTPARKITDGQKAAFNGF
jgi:hypothetical protein